jgi:L,D-peptidoglycan transpeptidase YkuD (ErfK/YbiS/YcfS/YnhG family)
MTPAASLRLTKLRVASRPGERTKGWLVAGNFRFPCALGPAGVVRRKREGDGGTPSGDFRLLWAYFRPDRLCPRTGGVALRPLFPDAGWCEDPLSARYNRPVHLDQRGMTDRMWREDWLYDICFVLDYNYSRRIKGRGSAIFFHLARPGLPPTAGCVALLRDDMRKLAPRLSKSARMRIS